MCIKGCSAKVSCKSVTFFVSNLTCMEFDIQTDDGKVMLLPNAYSINKISMGTSNIFPACSNRLWAIERYVHKTIPTETVTQDNNLIKKDGVSGRLRCTELCLQETSFLCRAFQYNYSNKQCLLLSGGRRVEKQRYLLPDANADYVENLCLSAPQRCPSATSFERYSDVVFPPFYFDKTLTAASAQICGQLCLSEAEFLCRSFLYDPSHQQCALSHSDRLSLDNGIMNTLPRIYATVLGRPLTDFYEVTCISDAGCSGFAAFSRYSSFELLPKNSGIVTASSLKQCEDYCLLSETLPCKFLEYHADNKSCAISSVRKQSATPRTSVGEGDFLENTCTKDTSVVKNVPQTTTAGTSTSITSSSVTIGSYAATTASRITAVPTSFLPTTAPSTQISRQNSSQGIATTVAISTTLNSTNAATNASLLASSASLVSSTATPTSVESTAKFGDVVLVTPSAPLGNLVTTNFAEASPQIGVACRFSTTNGKIANEFINKTMENTAFNQCQIYCESHSDCLSFSHSEASQTCLVSSSSYAAQRGMLEFIANSDFQFYEKGTACTDIRFECTDSDIIIKVNLDKPFRGRIFVDGVSGTTQCSSRFPNQKSFTWALPLSAQPCSTVYEGDGLFSNLITLQYHDQLVTKNDRKYRINCKYDIGVINVTSDTLTVSSTELTSMVTASPVPPTLNIAITDLQGNAVETATVGDTLLMTIYVPDNSTYGIGVKNCYAAGENPNERMQLTDDTGCPVLPEYFRPFVLKGKSLQADFDAFRFQNSFDITYQCTVQYCVDVCPQPTCNGSASNVTGMQIKAAKRAKRLASTWEDEIYIGTFNIRKILKVQDMPVRAEFSVEDGKTTANVCMATSIGIVLIIIACVLLVFDAIILVVVVYLKRKCARSKNSSIVISPDNS
ncbi:uncharacterized protein LOC129591201 isoform X2 [Paramacrobiotus metropolitanus]|nr:uncharacterized protein LOC129591201 isoform X2 [Paramacrobiotus metropolitanus]